MQTRAAGYALTYATTLKLRVVSGTIAGLTAASLSFYTPYAWLLLV
jgi:hypothetical protein